MVPRFYTEQLILQNFSYERDPYQKPPPHARPTGHVLQRALLPAEMCATVSERWAAVASCSLTPWYSGSSWAQWSRSPHARAGGGVHVVGDEGEVMQPRPLHWCLVHRLSPLVFHLYVALSNAARSQHASVAPASYVLWRNSSNTSSGVAACRTSSYSKMNADHSGLQKALLGRMGSRSNPAGVGSV